MIEPGTTARDSRAATVFDFLEAVVPLAVINFLIGIGLQYANPETTHPNLAAALAIFGAVMGSVRFVLRRWAPRSPPVELVRWISGGLFGGLGVAISGLLGPRWFQGHALLVGAALGTVVGLIIGLGDQRDAYTAGELAPRTPSHVREVWALVCAALVVVSVLLVFAFRAE